MDDEYEDLLAKRAETLAKIRYTIAYIRALIASLQTDFEKQQSHNEDTNLMYDCCKASKRKDAHPEL